MRASFFRNNFKRSWGKFSQKRTYSTDVGSTLQQATKESNKLEDDGPMLMRFWKVFGLAGCTILSVVYYNEADHYDRKINRVVKMIMRPEQDTRKEGLEMLRECFSSNINLFSGSAAVPQPPTFLIKEGVIEALLESLTTEDVEVRQKALTWLSRFVSEPVGRKRITDQGIPLILNTIAKSDNSSDLWLTGATLLLRLSQYPDVVQQLTTSDVLEWTYSSLTSDHPISKLMSARLLSQLAQQDPNLLTSDNRVSKEKIQTLTTAPAIAALDAAIQNTVPAWPSNATATLTQHSFGARAAQHTAWAAMFAAFGSVWGISRWALHGRFASEVQGSSLWKQVFRKNRVGRYVFFLLSLDLIAEGLMAWPSEGVRIPFTEEKIHVKKDPFGLPITSVVPIGEAFLFTGTALYALRTQRYIVLPMALAFTSAYWNQLNAFTKPYQDQYGVKLYKYDLQKPIFHFLD